MLRLKVDPSSPYQRLIGVGGVGTGVFFKLAGDHTLGRNESRSGELLDVRDYCKLHIIIHYVARLLGAGKNESGFEILPVAKVGDDAPGHSVLREMQDVGIDLSFVEILRQRPTLFSVCFQYPDGAGGNITTNNSAAADLSNADIDRIREQFAIDPTRTIALAAPEVSLSVRKYFLAAASQTGAFRAASFVSGEIAAARESEIFRLLDLVALNEAETAELLGCHFSESQFEPFVETCLAFVKHSFPTIRLVVSLGAHGVLGFAGEHWDFCPAPSVRVASTAGAGDALLAGVIAALAAGMPFLRSGRSEKRADGEPLRSALQFGTMLASYSVTSPHTIHPSASLDTLVEFMRTSGVQIGTEVEQLFVETCAKAHS
jgi:sugar/nucleoside kinase (ribokinase family)